MSDSGQVISSAAEVYDEFFLPALFQAWPPRLVEAAGLAPGQRVVDVACGTGLLAIAAAEAVGSQSAVVGVDLNPGMLAVARRKAPAIKWREAPAEALPFEAGSFDTVLSQFGLMFFEGRESALREMARVLRPGGRLAVAVWDSLANTPGYAAITKLLGRLFGDEVADLLRAPYVLGDVPTLRGLFSDAEIQEVDIQRVEGEARFPSIRSWMHTDVRGWTLADRIDDEQFERLVAEAEHALAEFVMQDGSVRFAHPALIAAAAKA